MLKAVTEVCGLINLWLNTKWGEIKVTLRNENESTFQRSNLSLNHIALGHLGASVS